MEGDKQPKPLPEGVDGQGKHPAPQPDASVDTKQHPMVASILSNSAEARESAPELPFLQSLRIDYPAVAERIERELPAWKTWVDGATEIDGFGAEMLNHVDYVSKQEEAEFFAGVAQEVQELLSAEDAPQTVYFTHHDSGGSGSGTYFFAQVQERLHQEFHDRVELVPSGKIHAVKDRETHGPLHIYICDDSANSGQQLHSVYDHVQRFARERSEMTDSFWTRLTSLSKVPAPRTTHAHGRLLRIADDAQLDYDQNQERFAAAALQCDLSAKRMPDTGDVLKKFDLQNADGMPIAGREAVWASSLPYSPAKLGFFYHRIQDNVARSLYCERADLEIPSLLKEGDIVKPY